MALSRTFKFLLAIATALGGVMTSSVPYTCTDFFTNVTASGMVQQIDLPTTTNNSILVEEILDALTAGLGNGYASITSGTVPYTGTYQVFSHYCVPVAGIQHDTLQYLVHGAAMDHMYWDWPQDPEMYSWQWYMAELGYATLAIDRLGAGESAYPDPLRVQQCNYEAAVNQALISNIRAGLVPQIPTSSFSKIVYVGHSLGSIIGNIMAVNFPSNSGVDGLILTGYSQNVYALQVTFLVNGHSVPATLANATLFPNMLFYLTNLDYAGRLVSYGLPGEYDPAVVQYDFDHRWTFSDGEGITTDDGSETATGFTPPVYIITGVNDMVFCGASLTGILDANSCDPSNSVLAQVPASAARFPDSIDFSYTIQNATGHNLNLHYVSQDSFAFVAQWLEDRGFANN